MRSKLFALIFSATLTLVITACAGFDSKKLFSASGGESPPSAITPGIELPPATPPTQTPEPSMASPGIITVWVPPFINPDENSKPGILLKERLSKFIEENPGIRVRVRVKNVTGQGGLLDSLSTSGAAAPLAVPSLIFLPRSDYENAALKGLLYPIDSLLSPASLEDWYPYSNQITEIQGQTYGLPFIGDSLVVLYRPEKVGYPAADWDQLMKIGQGMIFPAADPQAHFSLALYQSTGAAIKNEIGQPVLETDKLQRVLQFFLTGEKQGLFPSWLSQYENNTQAMQAYREMKANMLVTWISNYLSDLPADTVAMPLPPYEGNEFSPASGWVLTVTDPDPIHRAVSIKLAEYLVESEFLAGWTAASGYMPTRPSELPGWNNKSVQLLIDSVAKSSTVLPSSDVINSLGPILQDSTIQVLKQQYTPAQAAELAAKELEQPGFGK